MKPLRGIVYLLSILCFLENAGATSTSNRHQGGEFRILSMGPEVRGFSLGKEFDEVLPWLCSKLFEPDYDSQELIPVIGDKWKLSQDLKTLKITIRPNAFFHDGTPITAEDVAYSFEQQTKLGAHLTNEILLLASEGGTKILDHLNLEIKFRQPFHDDLKTLFNTLYILPQPTVKKNSNKKKLLEEMNCSGPYQFDSWPHGKKLTLKRFSKWFGFNDPNIKPLWSDFFHFSSVSFHFITDFHLIEPLMKKNEFDYFRVSPPIAKLVSDLLKNHAQFKKVTVKNNMPLDLHFIGVNFQNPYLKSLKLRKALASAFPFPLINQELFQDSLEPVYGPFTNNSPYFDSSTKPVSYSIPDCQHLTEQDGWIFDDNDSIRSKIIGGKKTYLKMTLFSGNRSNGEILNYYAQSLKKCGIFVDVQITDLVSFWKTLEDGAADLWMARIIPDSIEEGPQAAYSSKLPANVSLNYGHYNNPTVDQLFAEASATTDTETRVRLYKKAGKLISEDFASIFLFQTKNQSYIHSKRVSRMKDTFQYRIGTQTWWMTDPQ